MTTENKHWTWKTIDFRPAPTGWRLVYLSEKHDSAPVRMLVRTLPGWLVQEKSWYTFHKDKPVLRRADPPAHELPERRVIAGDWGRGEQSNAVIVPAESWGGAEFWKALPPGAEKPDQAAINYRLAEVEELRLFHAKLAEDARAARQQLQQTEAAVPSGP